VVSSTCARLSIDASVSDDDQTGLAQRPHEIGNLVAVIKRFFVSDEVPTLLLQLSAQPFYDFLALGEIFPQA
jgi:hypothetical protein